MTIIITGASRGIGNYLFRHFVDKGFVVYGTFNSTSCDYPEEVMYKVNITDIVEVTNWIEKIEKKLKDIVLINCAGINYNSYAHKSDVSEWYKVIDVNVKGTFNVIRSVLPVMRKQNFGRIINFSSVVTKLPTPGVSAYVASKSAIIGLTKSLAIENASRGITINSISLGYVNLGMGVNDVPAEYREKIKAQIPMKRFCEPEEILSLIRGIIDTPYLNGADIDLNGGII